MMDIDSYVLYPAYACNDRFNPPPCDAKQSLITGVGRSKYRPLSRHKAGDKKRREHRKMAKKSRRQNRRKR